jgi:hypothetical protein
MFMHRNCSVWTYNTVQLQSLTSTVCGKYCCLFALYMDRGFSPKQFIGLFDPGMADTQITRLFQSEFGSLRKNLCGGQGCVNYYKR